MLDNPPRNRDSSGRFLAGHSLAGPGRKPRETEEAYLQTMEQVTTAEAWRQIVERAVTDAIAGDAKARQWLSGYLLGMPVARIQAEEPESGLERIVRLLTPLSLGADTGDEK